MFTSVCTGHGSRWINRLWRQFFEKNAVCPFFSTPVTLVFYVTQCFFSVCLLWIDVIYDGSLCLTICNKDYSLSLSVMNYVFWEGAAHSCFVWMLLWVPGFILPGFALLLSIFLSQSWDRKPAKCHLWYSHFLNDCLFFSR